MLKSLTLLLLTASPLLVIGQQVGHITPEVHPPLPWQQCTKGGHCSTVHGEIVLDSNFRWVHNSNGKNCFDGKQWDPTACPDEVTCAKNCLVEGADYKATYGVSTTGNAVRLNFVTHGNVGSRLYLLANDSTYQVFKLLNKEFTFDVDMSTLPCGTNAAIYFVSMDADGGLAKHSTNKAGAKYGTGYCDSQCPMHMNFIDGKANFFTNGKRNHGLCCAEMDLWEANAEAAAMTLHPCDPIPSRICNGAACETDTRGCDPEGCDFNSYRMGNHSFYGPGKTIDTNKIFTVVTQFITSDGTDKGHLTEVRRFYVQNGKVIPNSMSTIAGVPGNSVTQEYCNIQKKTFHGKDLFSPNGGVKKMGDALGEGMVLTFSIWDDSSTDMLWLDSIWPKDQSPSKPGIARGPCPITLGGHKDLVAKHPNAYVAFSNMKVGPINSTFGH